MSGTAEHAPIADRFVVDLASPLREAGGGLPAFAVRDLSGGLKGLMAVQVQRRHPARAVAIATLGTQVEGVLCPVARGAAPASDGTEGYYIVAPAPVGPPLSAQTQAWGESELLEQVLRPAARALQGLAQKGVTHRAIRANNVFQAPGGVVLGMAWAGPAAMHQPVLAEPPESAMCLPEGRGDGVPGDDVYALGVLLLTLALSGTPLQGVPDQEVIERKLTLGSYAALVGDQRLPSVISDLLRGMLAEDPEHRPSPALLMEPNAARARRVAARPARQAQRPLELGGVAAWNARTLALGLAREPEQGLKALRAGVADTWLRRSLVEPNLAAKLDEVIRNRGGRSEPRNDTVVAMRAVAVLDPLAPLSWRGVSLWPSGLGPALASAEGDAREALLDLVATEGVALWASQREGRCDERELRGFARRARNWLTTAGASGGAERLTYTLNPLLPCGSPLLRAAWVAEPAELLPALERRAAGPDLPSDGPMDRHIACFVASRADRRLEQELSGLRLPGVSSTLALLARLQGLFGPGSVPRLAAWVAGSPELGGWQSKTRRGRLMARLRDMAAAGQMMPMLALVQDQAEREADSLEARAASGRLAEVERVLAGDAGLAEWRAEVARRWGYEAATGLGLAGLAVALVLTVFA